MNRTPAERELMKFLGDNVDAFDMNHADDIVVSENLGPRGGTEFMEQQGTPKFNAQFTLQLLTQYYTLNGGAYTSVAAAGIAGGLQNSLPFFIFGTNDFASGYKKLKSQFSISSNWSYGRPFVVGRDVATELALDATVTGNLRDGDLVIPFTSTLPGAGTTTLALNIVRCSGVGYGSLLEMLSSDRFTVRGIRYVLGDATQITQFENDITFLNLSIFGKSDTDTITPTSFKDPNQFQNGIIDIPIKRGMDKHKSFAFFNNYDNVSKSWNVFVWGIEKLSA